MPCIDNQNIAVVIQYSRAIATPNIYDLMLTIQIFMGILLRGTKNLNISVIPYVNGPNSTPRLFTPTLSSGHVTETECMNALTGFQDEALNNFQTIVANTDAGYTIQALEQFLVRGEKNTVVTFSGTVSKEGPANNIVIARILKGIQDITNTFGSNKVEFFSAGYYGRGDPNRQISYEKEVKALGNNEPGHITLVNVQWELLRKLAENLYNHGVLCQEQSKYIICQIFYAIG